MKSAKEKAEELFNKYFSKMQMPSDCEGCMQCFSCLNMVAIAKTYALIAVDEIINTEVGNTVKGYDYWQEVKTEIEKI